MLDRLAPWEKTLSFTSTEAEEVIPAINDPSLIGVMYRFLSYDEAELAGGADQTAQFALVPTEQTDLFGGSTLQTPYAAVLRGKDGGAPTVRGNALDLGDRIVRPGEAVTLRYKAANSVSMRVRVERIKLYDPRWRAAVNGSLAS